MRPVASENGGGARWRAWALLLGAVVAAAVAAISFVGFVVAPPIVQSWGASWLGARLGRRVAIARVRVNPFSLGLTLEGLRVFEADGRTVFVGVPRLYANVEVVSLLRHALILRELRVDSPRARVVHDAKGDNWSDLPTCFRGAPGGASPGSASPSSASPHGAAPSTASPSSALPGSAWPRSTSPGSASPESTSDGSEEGLGVSLRNVQIIGGALTYEDRTTGRRHELSALDARVPFFSTIPGDKDRAVAPTARFRVDGARVQVEARVKRRPDATEAIGTLRVADAELARFAREVPLRMPFVPRKGVLDCDLEWTLSFGDSTKAGVAGRLSVEDLVITGERSISVGTVALDVRRAEVQTGGEGPSQGTVDVALRVGKAGRGTVEGTFSVEPVAAALRFRLRDLDLTPVAPELGHALHAIVQGGVLSAEGHLDVTRRAARRHGKASLRVALAGEADVAGFSSLDARDHSPFLGWHALHASGVTFSSGPPTLIVRHLGFEGLAFHLVHRMDRSWNIPRGAPRTARRAHATGSVSVGELTVRAGSFTLFDGAVAPPFTVALDDITARASGFSSRDGPLAKLEASAHPAGAATFAVSGGIGVKGGRFAADLSSSANEFNVSRLTPYSVKYTGYAIAGGILDVTSRLRISQGRLQMENQGAITSPKVGEKVQNARGKRLPMPVTVSLLQNRRGVIHLSVPVEGSFDDPQFHLGRAIGRALRNVVLKTVASPFTLLGKVFGGGGGEDISHVEFRAGKTNLDGSAEGVVRTLAKALRERSQLEFWIEGHADPERDGGRPGHDLPALARHRADVVRDALARAAPEAAPRLRMAAPKVEKGAGCRVQLRLED